MFRCLCTKKVSLPKLIYSRKYEIRTLYDIQLGLKVCLSTYCKVTPVSIILPFKMGELYRMYCYGRQSGIVLRSVVIILLDRFMDTAALVTVITLIWIFDGGRTLSLIADNKYSEITVPA